MNGRNRHLQYRKSVYRRRRLRTILITVGVLLAVLLVAFLVIGNILQNKSEERRGEESESQTAAPTLSEEKTPYRKIGAYSVVLETADDSSFADRLAALPDPSSAVSIPLTDKEGALLYRSPIALSLGLQSEDAYTVTVASALQAAGDRYTSGVFYLTALFEEDAKLRSVRLSQSAAVLAEALEGGLNEILLIAPAMTEAQTDEVLYFADSIRRLAPDAVVGLSLTEVILSSENAAAVIDRLYNGVDFLAVAAASTEGDPIAQAEQTINDPGMRYNLLRYHMRLLLPVSDDATQTALIETVKNEGFDNWQFVR